MGDAPVGVWPKTLPPLTEEQQVIADDFMRYWHEVLPRRYGMVERFNHRYVLRSLPRDGGVPVRTLEIGAGLGEHLEYEDLTTQEYSIVELRPEMAERPDRPLPDR